MRGSAGNQKQDQLPAPSKQFVSPALPGGGPAAIDELAGWRPGVPVDGSQDEAS